jgi:hypothetical protein
VRAKCGPVAAYANRHNQLGASDCVRLQELDLVSNGGSIAKAVPGAYRYSPPRLKDVYIHPSRESLPSPRLNIAISPPSLHPSTTISATHTAPDKERIQGLVDAKNLLPSRYWYMAILPRWFRPSITVSASDLAPDKGRVQVLIDVAGEVALCKDIFRAWQEELDK